MAPITTASDESNHQALLDKLDMHRIHKPFRNPSWKPPQRRNKTVKQILSEAQRREQSFLATQNNSGSSTPLPSTTNGTAAAGAAQQQTSSLHPNPAQASQDLTRLVLEKNQNQTQVILPPTPSYTYTSIAAAPSLKPKQRYCDITGLPAPYQDPKTGLRYHNKEIYAVVKTLSTAQVQDYLAARGANTVLK